MVACHGEWLTDINESWSTPPGALPGQPRSQQTVTMPPTNKRGKTILKHELYMHEEWRKKTKMIGRRDVYWTRGKDGEK